MDTEAGVDAALSSRWADDMLVVLKRQRVEIVTYVPDSGHARLIKLCHADPSLAAVALTTEEEGVGVAAGAWLGGKRSVLLMQSSGVGNCVNVLSLQKLARVPLVMVVTMRGEFAELNPWQVPMGSNTEAVLKLCDCHVYRVNESESVAENLEAALEFAYGSDIAVAVLLSQRLIGRKKWVK